MLKQQMIIFKNHPYYLDKNCDIHYKDGCLISKKRKTTPIIDPRQVISPHKTSSIDDNHGTRTSSLNKAFGAIFNTSIDNVIASLNDLENQDDDEYRYLYSYMGNYEISYECLINKEIYEILGIEFVSISLELDRRTNNITSRFRLQMNNENESWINSFNLDIKNDPIFISALQEKMKENSQSFSIEHIQNNIIEIVSTLKLLSY